LREKSILGADSIVRSRTLPGFQFRIRDLLGRTAIEDLRHDPVYRAFVHPAWQQEEEARQQAELERQQAQQSQQQAELDRRAEQQARQATEQTLREAEQQRDAAVVKLRDLGLGHGHGVNNGHGVTRSWGQVLQSNICLCGVGIQKCVIARPDPIRASVE
jgi:hypothetical protein